jgi:WD40 repeat protein
VKRLLMCGVLTAMLIGSVSAVAQDQVATSAQAITMDSVDRMRLEGMIPLEGVTHVGWSADNVTLGVSTTSGMYLFDIRTLGSPPRLLGMHASPITDFDFNSDGTQIATVSGAVVRVWQLASDAVISEFSGSMPIDYSDDGRFLAYSNGATGIILRDLQTNLETVTLEGHTDRITDVAFMPGSAVITTTSLDTTLRLWNPESGDQIAFQRSRRRPQLAVDSNMAGSIVASGTRGGSIRLLNVAVTTERRLTLPSSDDVLSIDFSDAAQLLAFTAGDSLYLWNADIATDPVELPLGGGLVVSAMFSPNGEWLAAGSQAAVYVYRAG